MNPPLRTKEDMEALCQGLKDDIMDVIATDHAPHTEEEKRQPIEKAPFGIVGLETAVPLLFLPISPYKRCLLSSNDKDEGEPPSPLPGECLLPQSHPPPYL